MRTGLAMSVAFGLLLGAGAAKDTEALQGSWQLTSGEANGKELPEQQLKDGSLVIKGDHYRVTLHGRETITGAQKLDSAAKLKTIDITDSTGPHKGETSLGIYELKGDEFRVAFAPPGKPRPSKFSTTPDSGHWVHVWKRVKE